MPGAQFLRRPVLGHVEGDPGLEQGFETRQNRRPAVGGGSDELGVGMVDLVGDGELHHIAFVRFDFPKAAGIAFRQFRLELVAPTDRQASGGLSYSSTPRDPLPGRPVVSRIKAHLAVQLDS